MKRTSGGLNIHSAILKAKLHTRAGQAGASCVYRAVLSSFSFLLLSSWPNYPSKNELLLVSLKHVILLLFTDVWKYRLRILWRKKSWRDMNLGTS